MTFSDVTIRILFLMLPGIIAAKIIEQLTVHKHWKQFRFVINAFLLGVLSYSLMTFVVKYSCLKYSVGNVSFWAALFDQRIPINMYEIFYASIAGLCLGLFLSKAIQDKWLHRLARHFKISDKYGDENLFSYFLNSKEVSWVYVRDFKNRLTYFGLRTALSENDDIQEIVLADVTVYSLDDSIELYKMPVVYLSYKIGEIIMELPTT